MKHNLLMKLRRHDKFADVEVKRNLDIELFHDGEPVEIEPTSWESLEEQYPQLKGATHRETYMTDQGNVVFRCIIERDNFRQYYTFEKVI